jgi:Ser/Thr protein kinase RdoA (MazF antagonist)
MDYDDRTFDRVNFPPRALALWAAAEGSLEPVRESSNFVYRFRDPAGQERYLRIAPPGRRVFGEVVAELDFINYLDAHGVPVSRPVPSLAGKGVEVIETPQGEFYATVFEAVYGQEPMPKTARSSSTAAKPWESCTASRRDIVRRIR